jgi:membrane-associated HD superfamily phosphohydrolase
MIDDRINENQLAEADVTIKEINTIREVMKWKLSQSYHARIVYPDRKR